MCCSVGVEPHPRTHTPTHTRTPSLCGKAQGLIWGILSVSWSACQVHCVTGDSMTSSQPLQSYASASISLHIYTHTHRHGVVGGGGSNSSMTHLHLSDARAWLGPYTLHVPPHSHTHLCLSWMLKYGWITMFYLPPPMPLFWFLFFSCLSTSLSFFLSFYSDTLLCGRLKQCRMPLYRSITASSLFLDIYLCLVFFFPGIPLLLLPLSLLLLLLPPLLPYFQAFLSFHRFATLLPPSPTLTSYSFSNSISPLLLQHTKQNFSDYFSSWETLETQVRDPPPLPSAVTMTTATALSFIEEGWKEGGGAGSLLCVVTQR